LLIVSPTAPPSDLIAVTSPELSEITSGGVSM
jgi:hypothetical protein